MARKIKVLFVVMEFAPVNTTGNFRTLKFIKYLPALGIEPVVVTLKAEEASKLLNAPIDNDLLKELPDGIHIHRVSIKQKPQVRFRKLHDFINIYFSIGESSGKWWWPFLKKEIGPIIEQHKPSAIYTSLPPFSTGAIAVKISKKFKLPLIVDMRDLWAYWGVGPHKSWLHYRLTKKAEEKIFRQATTVVAVTPPMIRILQRCHPSLDAGKFRYIPNGFDKNAADIDPFSVKPGKKEIVIGYVGSFYYDPEQRENLYKKWWQKKPHHFIQFAPVKFDWLYRSPYFFFRTIAYIRKNYPEIGDRIRIEFVGRKPAWLDVMLNEFDLQSCFTSHGFVDYSRSIELQKRFDLLLATSEKVEDGDHFCLPSKVFDYVGTGKPVLGFVTKGIQREFLEKSGIGVICDPDDVQSATDTLIELVSKGKDFVPDMNYLSTFQRNNLAIQLADVIEEAVTGTIAQHPVIADARQTESISDNATK